MFIKPLFYKFSNSIHIRFNNDIIFIIDKYNSEVLKVTVLFLKFKEHNQHMEIVFKKTRGNVLTNKIILKDDERDNLIKAIKAIAEAYLLHNDQSLIDAAVLLLQQINKYGERIDKMKYNAETTVLEDLIDNVKNNTELKAAVTALGLDDWFVRLETSNNEFIALYQQRTQENSLKSKEDMQVLRKESVKFYTDFIELLRLQEVLEPSELYENCRNEINEFINKYNTEAKRGKHKNDDDDPEDGE